MPDVTDWISAWSDVAAAVGTVGALWVGAVTLRRQVNDQHRAQVRAVTVGSEVETRPLQESRPRFFITNSSNLPIYSVVLEVTIEEGKARRAMADVILPGKSLDLYGQGTAQRKVHGAFTDSAGHRFIRDDKGKITEYPKSLRRRDEFSNILTD
ncbi:hypothetical protein AB0P28_05980 [Pseudarthrobacter sp. NPDC089323]